ncbi:MAG: orotidine-5'-phosphate decarboxylase [Phycisphaerales bacterium]
MSVAFADRLAESLNTAGSACCVGLDPVYERLPAGLRCGTTGGGPVSAIARFCEGVLDAVAGTIPVIKPQSACFERYGAEGVACLAHVCRCARERGLIVVLDAKRGDIGISAEHYAEMAFGSAACGADAVTVSAYLGADTIEPFLTDPARGVFALVRTSNPGSDSIQSARLGDGRTVAELVADEIARLGATRLGTGPGAGLSSVGVVVGATKAADAAALRRRMPAQVFLIPGYGAQGGTADDIRGMLRSGARSPGTAGVLVSASRSVIYPGGAGAGDWRQAVGVAARAFAAEIGAVVSEAFT